MFSSQLTTVLYTLVVGLSAFLLFLVQPLVAKMLLPDFGGGASIWVTSVMFFQVMLLVGYWLTHVLISRWGLGRHRLFLLVLMVASFVAIPLSVAQTHLVVESPVWMLLMLLSMSAGLPYLVLSMTSPTLQFWMANDVRVSTTSPYLQYGVSNLGSLLGLLCFPFVMEAVLTTSQTALLWTGAFVGYALLVLVVAGGHRLANGNTDSQGDALGNVKLVWFVQAMVPSAMLLVVTHYLTLDVVNLPLLWVAPLALYLCTFILCFLVPAVSQPNRWRMPMGLMCLLLLLITSRPELGFSLSLRVVAALVALSAIGLIVHGDLERGKPDKQQLTGFYLMVAAGGAAGSVLVALIAPLVFDSTLEFYIVILAALYYLIHTGTDLTILLRRIVEVCIVFFLFIAFLVHETGLDGRTIARERSFYSSYAIRDSDGVRSLVAGTHVHGEQYLDDERRNLPLAYYHRKTGVAELLTNESVSSVALVGLGIGSLVEYLTSDDRVDIYELDPLVVRLARRYFTVLDEAGPVLRYFVGDGRVSLNGSDESYDLIVMDAFTSGSIPTHLVTVEAVAMLTERLTPDGAIAYHISNHHLDLLPVLNGIAGELNLDIRVHQSAGNEGRHEYPARWVVVAPRGWISGRNLSAGWRSPDQRKLVWRDESANVRSILR